MDEGDVAMIRKLLENENGNDRDHNILARHAKVYTLADKYNAPEVMSWAAEERFDLVEESTVIDLWVVVDLLAEKLTDEER